ncbi:SIMPL domain-containing protein [Sandarakinorhabdus sp.]|uniref:SIMPL domain-containing protein n=1 Tax=Sandarakinorhabdus sp. TaxID=1916663 RepID=UPI00286E88B8|nr:SIMPL domain-containing protein [Sandarakinorhabdus sp.]
MNKMMMAGCAALAGIAGPVSAQTPAAAPAVLTIIAEGRSLRTPDIAELSGGVVTQAATAAAAMADNAARMARVVTALRKAGIADRDIQTSGLSLQPQYRYDNGAAPVITGYQASNMVTTRVRKIADTGRLLDTLVSVGANQIGGPVFQIEAAGAAQDEARRAAVSDARARAALYAGAAGMKLGRILSITEGSAVQGDPRPMMKMASAQLAETTPVAPGEMALTVSVTMTFALD